MDGRMETVVLDGIETDRESCVTLHIVELESVVQPLFPES